MCVKCKELDEKIAHYRPFASMAFDPITTLRTKAFVDNLQRMRDAMHEADAPRRSRPEVSESDPKEMGNYPCGKAGNDGE